MVRLDGPGGSNIPEGGYDPTFFDRLATVEDQHFWFRARNRLILDLCRRSARNLESGCRILEVGCGTGNVLRYLERAYIQGTVIGMDLWREGLRYARQRTRCSLVQGDMRSPPFREPFHVVGMFDVLEHIADDKRALQDLHAMLLPGGTLLLTVPAHQSLWSYFDESAKHCRRYSMAELRDTLNQAGYQVETMTEFMACTFPLVWLTRRLAGLRNRDRDPAKARKLTDDEFRIIPVVNTLLGWIMGLEARYVSRGHSLPFGTSILAVARRH